MDLLLGVGLMVSLGIYGYILSAYAHGWRAIEVHPASSCEDSIAPLVSVVIAARNERHNLEGLIPQLLAQSYPHIEVLIVDDHSDDGTSSLSVSEHSRILSNSGHGKKEALETALSHARGQFVLFADADVQVGQHWVRSMVESAMSFGAEMVAGPVIAIVSRKGGWMSHYVVSELFGWLTLTGGAIQDDLHPMANGANMLVDRSALPTEDPFKKRISDSGDDLFLARYFYDRKTLVFNKSREAVVHTFPVRTLVDLWQQRVRWSSKMGRITGSVRWYFAAQALVYVVFVLGLFYWLIAPWKVGILLVVFVLFKAFFDYRLISASSEWMGCHTTYGTVLYLQVINIPLNIIVGISNLLGIRPSWKGRKR